MSDSNPDDRRRARHELESEVARKRKRKLKAQREGEHSAWFGLGMFGLVGWSVAIPTLLGIALGAWIDSHWPNRFSWTLMLMVMGVTVGCLNAWWWVQRESQDEE
ncbi:AtpZ/AtpI family protein [uncultured Rubinisphaera sp.]|uniref:AtpZ/AtpI family protein n=1 Tax=uncultured Rubinisphaera sp. TaxID=1678686 RepID=UPI0030D744D5